ncbi:hypothetical protein BDZ90DRAFT_88341 [Jaminaea rosea]|uniref:Uncharacterized protein n=1 Tax=Jaminaea rosea TaxID=1569628 RepID=A0A316UI49_9BASI|nr:hypothetical protein BDZ90DRAFT_88341 [Jaminaea rosea]PWN24900.1 hypothetical protein BDZ90DRAFT_88341 [Jaminaea rosea]
MAATVLATSVRQGSAPTSVLAALPMRVSSALPVPDEGKQARATRAGHILVCTLSDVSPRNMVQSSMPRSRTVPCTVIGVHAVSSAARALPRSDMKPSGSVSFTTGREYKSGRGASLSVPTSPHARPAQHDQARLPPLRHLHPGSCLLSHSSQARLVLQQQVSALPCLSNSLLT